MKNSTILGAFALLALAAPVAAQWNASRADSHAPVGVMGDHRHEAGEVMLSYRYMAMTMEGSRIGTDPIADADIVSPGGGFMVTPTRMPMTMHMFGAMFAPSDRITFMAMLPFVSSSMDHITRHGGSFTTESGGMGDVKVGAMIGLADWANQSLHLNAMVGLPTGSIEERGVLPISQGMEVQLPYPMQIGSGTLDLRPGLTWLGQAGDWSWGAQGNAVMRTGRNERDWALGNKVQGTAWWARVLGRNVSAGVRLVATRTGNIDGRDAAPSVNPQMVPTARTDLRAGTVVEGGVSFNLYIPRARAFRIAGEVLLPLVRDLEGPQLETDLTFVLGLQIVPISH
ncbi:MAG: transporter [Gemmatimonadales bacterium]|uniref:transporter n=1 Tax=Candidatus Palauibacter irciniicola TaxID=3056733 RepID=UPI001385725C|nr:transporter [Candidatus Palauibacter irciniicola]MYC19705.1 transporter [Gemmatimonadales bacterium]